MGYQNSLAAVTVDLDPDATRKTRQKAILFLEAAGYAMTDELTGLSSKNLLVLYRRVMDELRTRKITRSSNNPVADYSEFLFCLAFEWSREDNSTAGFDALDGDVRYQIKGRRPTKPNPSRQLSAIRKMEGNPFDFLAGVIFDEDFGVFRAALIPLSIVRERARKSSHVNGWLFNLDDAVWLLPGFRDVTEYLRNAQNHAKHG